ncbi:nucleoside-diphosphate sugar epimerase/dehydratase [Acinetobacter kookii]|uniref:NDP-sugar epimerase, includes UDP-GlcNAc-inverting 4,6-dehydratase FlaA1 and capsular polysaccharide biosynthesis protein EpsC n=1 Tax=Acinetobacter kookii TaxID=1226327 RepID=A0A1G6M266_9GAMM|nr:nucleoside-diphosphate sugar epimerase/dehydratase [Acinetobacter kookii]SDC49075.1 NDP-sugar epimerase, includes UDP-GlcNAc-inverting 4,6-dehydratase FlaA1 and capsular polysaccharide biosynthesis protein EpsC [Acinetobacter kookii]
MKDIIRYLASLPRRQKQIVLVAMDICVLPVIMWLVYAIRLATPNVAVMQGFDFWYVYVGVFGVLVFTLLGIYSAIVRSFNEDYLLRLSIATFIQIVGLYAIKKLNLAFIPMSIPLMYGFVLFSYMWWSRAVIRYATLRTFAKKQNRKRVAIYGAGLAGQQIAAALHRSDDYLPICFIDDKASLHGQSLSGLKIYAPKKALGKLGKFHIEEILLAMPSVSRARKKEMIESFELADVKIMELPGVTQLVGGQVQVSDIREVDIIDLLGRDPVPPKPELLEKNIKNKVVMVTGAGGSIGSELCRQIVKHQPKLLVLFEMSEFALYSIDRELQNSGIQVVPVLGSVTNQAKLERIIAEYQVQTVYHAAAYKHVPLVEANPFEGIYNTSIGTARSVDAAVNQGVETFVLISTDKAVRPTNVMGASKRMAELYCQGLAATKPQTQISIVRFGNVLGSSGSVVPLFKKQIAQGGPVTVTHPEVTRYFMTIPEAAQLVIQAGAMGTGGDVFLLDMGEPVKIVDLAKQMIRLSGFRPVDENGLGDIEIQFTGLRPGEKLYEELLIDQENVEKTEHERILKSFEKFYSYNEISHVFNDIKTCVNQNQIPELLSILAQYVDDYKYILKSMN